MLPGLTEYEARQIIQQALGRIPETTTKQILRQTGHSIRRLAKLVERLKELSEINEGYYIADWLRLVRRPEYEAHVRIAAPNAPILERF